MPNKQHQIKHARQSEKRRLHNRAKRSALRTSLRRVREALDGQATGEISIEARLSEAQSKLDKAAKTNLIKKNAARRTIGRLMAKAAAAKA
jgi:small subunit ribosomal protein S20